MRSIATANALDSIPVVSPPLKWAGGKRWQVPHLRPLWEAHAGRRLVEPFCGGLAVALGLMPKHALLNDINPYLISFYGWLKKGPHVDVRLENDEAVYYANRKRFNELLRIGAAESEEVAGLFYFLNRTGYNGLCRFNRSGKFNVPFGSYKRITYTRDFSPYRSVFDAWDFLTRDFESMPIRKDDFIYADPPYDVEFTQYAEGGFTWEDQVRAAEWLAATPKPELDLIEKRLGDAERHHKERQGSHGQKTQPD